jgi:hypothetical protein
VRVAADSRCIVCILIVAMMLRGTHGAHGHIDKPSPTSRAEAVQRMCNGWGQSLRHATAHNESHAGYSSVFAC